MMALACLVALGAGATPQLSNNTGLWWRSDESGWGLYLTHQGDTMFGTLFVYGPDNQPMWFSAPSLVGSGMDLPRVYTGALYESTGAPFNVPFDASTVTRREVGTMTVEVAGFGATLKYSVDDLRMEKQFITPLSFRSNEVSGNYTGVRYRAPTSTAGAMVDDVTIALEVAGSSFTMATQGSISGSCTYSGTATPSMGNEVYFSGQYRCGNAGNNAIGFYIDPTPDGFTTQLGGLIGLGGATMFSAVRTGPATFIGNGWMNDLWIAPNESGWGLNLVGEGDMMFGTLFVYDASRRPKWYTASDLRYVGSNGPDNRGRYEGGLYESTGPWYGLVSFNASKVTRRQVGTMRVDFLGNRTANVTYTVDGVTVVKQVEPFAMRANVLSGAYVGKRIDLTTGTAETLGINVNDNGGVSITTHGPGGDCTYEAPSSGRGQAGQRVFASGSYRCGNGRTGTFSLADAEVSFFGFTGTFVVDGRAGHIAASRGS